MQRPLAARQFHSLDYQLGGHAFGSLTEFLTRLKRKKVEEFVVKSRWDGEPLSL